MMNLSFLSPKTIACIALGRETHKMMLAAYTQVKNIYISTREEREGFY